MATLKLNDNARGVALSLSNGTEAQLHLTYQSATQNLSLSACVAFGPAQSYESAELSALLDQTAAQLNPELQLRQSNLARRAGLTLPVAATSLRAIANWLMTSREDTNYSYDLTPQNLLHLAHTLAAVTGRTSREMAVYLAEPAHDAALTAHIGDKIDALPPELRATADRHPKYARRLGWYALVRAMKPQLVVETGVDKGLGGVLLCAALLRNAAEGKPGRYLGTDIRPTAGFLVAGRYAEVGSIAYGDSLASLAKIDRPIDLFINDSDHTLDYEAREYQAIASRLNDASLVLSDNAHVTDALVNFAAETRRRFLFFREQPANHFYPGAGIGFAFK